MSAAVPASPSPATLGGAYLGVVLIWSTTPLGIVWSSEGLDYRHALLGRTLIGLLIAGLMLAARGTRLPTDPRALLTYGVSAVGLVTGLGLTYWAAHVVPSGLISVLFGLMPLFTSLFAAIFLREETLGLRKLLGLGCALGGLFIIFGGGVDLGEQALPGIAAILVAVASQAAVLIWIKRSGAHLETVPYTFGMLGVGSLLMLPILFVTGPLPDVLPVKSALAVLYLGVFGSVAGFALYYYVTKHLATGVVSLITLVTPVMALLLGHVLNAESIPLTVWAGVAAIGAGLALHQWHALRLLGAPAAGWLLDLARR
jgi:drug/metabolite transporter (DMT)-like permease